MGQKLYSAVKSDNIEDAQKWLQRGADPNTLGGHLGWTVLVQACSNGSQGMVELLLANGASVNLSSSGETPLAKAAQSRRPEVVELLLQNGAMVNQVDKVRWRYTNDHLINYSLCSSRLNKLCSLMFFVYSVWYDSPSSCCFLWSSHHC
jgi:ankyrin repeat protein